jgi:hypothetical protein
METISFDFLADPEEQRRRREREWRVQAALVRAEARTPKDLTELRTRFLKDQALDEVNGLGHGNARIQIGRAHV